MKVRSHDSNPLPTFAQANTSQFYQGAGGEGGGMPGGMGGMPGGGMPGGAPGAGGQGGDDGPTVEEVD